LALKIVRRRGRTCWYIRGTINGKRYDETTGTSDREFADAYRRKREQEIHREAIHGKAVAACFSDAVEHYLAGGGSDRFLEKLVSHLGPLSLEVIGQAKIDWVASKLYPGRKNSTLNRQVYGPVSAVLHHAAQLGWCSVPAIKRPRLPAGRVRWLTKLEADRLLHACNPSMRRIVLFMLYSGARVGETLWLEWDSVDLQRRHVTFAHTKNGTSRGVPLHSRIVQMLEGLDHREGAIFLTPRGTAYSKPKLGQSLDVSAGTRIKSAFGAACRRAGIDDFHPHDCRHTWATWHYMKNRDISALMHLGGWKTMSMAMRYAHTNVAEHANSIELL